MATVDPTRDFSGMYQAHIQPQQFRAGLHASKKCGRCCSNDPKYKNRKAVHRKSRLDVVCKFLPDRPYLRVLQLKSCWTHQKWQKQQVHAIKTLLTTRVAQSSQENTAL